MVWVIKIHLILFVNMHLFMLIVSNIVQNTHMAHNEMRVRVPMALYILTDPNKPLMNIQLSLRNTFSCILKRACV